MQIEDGRSAAPIPTATPSIQAFEAGPNDAFEQNKRLGRGINLANALEAPQEGQWGVVLHESYFRMIKQAGFTSVRIPIRWSGHATASPPYTIDPKFFGRVDWVINQALAHRLAVVINVQNYDELMRAPEENQARFLALWKQIAWHYQSYSNDLLFELLNEPSDGLRWWVWNDLIDETLAVIRPSNPDRNVVVGPVDWYNYNRLSDLKLPEDDRHLIVTIHYYLPFQFTHQGAEWVPDSQPWLNTRWTGSEQNEDAIAFDLQTAARWAKENDRPLYLGEFGAYRKADEASRVLWTSFVAREAEKLGMSWSYWEFCAGFGVYNPSTRVWNDPILDALIPPLVN